MLLQMPGVLGLLLISACATTAGETVSKILEATGVKKPEVPEVPALSTAPFFVGLRLHAGENLNAGSGRVPLGLLVHIYKLKDANAFEAAPFEAFLDPAREREALGSDLVEMREILLVPGQHYQVTEKLPREAGYLGIVGLFRAPNGQRWRLTFAAEEAQRSGLSIAALACAFVVASGNPTAGTAAFTNAANCE